MLNAEQRQKQQPEEFRIGPGTWPAPILQMVTDVARLLQAPPPANAPASKELDRFLAELGTGLWRLQQRLATLHKGEEPSGDIKKLLRTFDATWDGYVQGGLEVRGHDGEPIVGGEALEIVAFQPTPGLARDQVIETIRPSVYHRDRLIQMGQVIVGQPVAG